MFIKVLQCCKSQFSWMIVNSQLVQDLFYLHDRARKINIWASFVILSPYFGPLFTAFIISTQKW
jgi:hypothetical protein